MSKCSESHISENCIHVLSGQARLSEIRALKEKGTSVAPCACTVCRRDKKKRPSPRILNEITLEGEDKLYFWANCRRSLFRYNRRGTELNFRYPLRLIRFERGRAYILFQCHSETFCKIIKVLSRFLPVKCGCLGAPLPDLLVCHMPERLARPFLEQDRD
ncbi:MAG: hypothetical protein AB7E52_02580 [Bdellovibrionales bacterium]